MDEFEPLDEGDPTTEMVEVVSIASRWQEPSMEQLVRGARRARNRAELGFARKVAANPHLYRLFEAEVLADVERGAEAGSARFFFHLLRWKRRRDLRRAAPVATAKNPDTELPLLLVDQHDAYMARLFEERNKHLRGFFRKARIGERRAAGGGPIEYEPEAVE